MNLLSVTASEIDNFYDLLLIEKEGQRALSIPVGEYEGQNIALSIDKIKVSRPLTFDLLCNVFELTGVKVKNVTINDFIDGTFFANICCEFNNETIYLDARCSDAINVAIKLEVPILAEEKVLDSAGFEIDNPNAFEMENDDDFWTIEELESLLKAAEEEGDSDIIDIIKEKIKELKNDK